MNRCKSLCFGICLLALLGMPACQNPADGRPEAQVAEPVKTESLAEAEGTLYSIQESSRIDFVGSKVTGSHEGGFNTFTGQIVLVDDDPASSRVSVTIDTTSLWADSDGLAEHLKSPEFFDVEKFASATLETTEISGEAGMYTLTGNLNLHGVTKSISFPAQISVGNKSITASAEFSIKRFDFDIVYPGRADDLIRDEVLVKIAIEAIPADSRTAG